MELYPRHLTALGNGRQASMERLNEIINRTAQRRQGSGLDKSSSYNTPPQGSRAGSLPGHRPLPEQNARLGQYTHTPRSEPQPGTINRPPAAPRSQQNGQATRSPGNARIQGQYVPGNRSTGERFAPSPERERGSWPQVNHAPARRAEIYRTPRPTPQADTQEDWSGEWEEDTAPIRYGDWESDGYDESAPSRDASDSYALNRANARIAQTYPGNQRSMVTRDLRAQLDEEAEPTVTPHTRESRLPIPLPPPPATPQARQPSRLTQPLNRSTSMARLKQDVSNTPQPVIPAPYTATFAPSSTEVYDQLFQKMREAALLVLDDLGAQQSSPWANEKLFQLLNYRYNSRIPTIITTNNTGLQGVEERIRSRMIDTSLVTRITFEDAIDYRQRN